jgi:hypothetical protein
MSSSSSIGGIDGGLAGASVDAADGSAFVTVATTGVRSSSFTFGCALGPLSTMALTFFFFFFLGFSSTLSLAAIDLNYDQLVDSWQGTSHPLGHLLLRLRRISCRLPAFAPRTRDQRIQLFIGYLLPLCGNLCLSSC